VVEWCSESPASSERMAIHSGEGGGEGGGEATRAHRLHSGSAPVLGGVPN